MSTIYTFHRECAALLTPATGDRIMVADISDNASHPGAQTVTLAIAKTAARGVGATDLIGFYGATPVNQGTMTATALTAVTTNPTFSATTGAGVYGFPTSTLAKAYVARIPQMQVDIAALMARVNSTGLVDISGL